MSAAIKLRRAPRAAGQRGQVMLLTALLIAIGIIAAVLTSVTQVSVATTSRLASDTEKTLIQVKQALILWSARRNPAADGINARPGELPCPDKDAPGTAGYGWEDGSCVAGAIGRVPWKTLGIDEPKDETGETLWYTLSGLYRIYNMSSAPITSDTVGNITVYQGSTATSITTQAVAVIFAPGSPRGNQVRNTDAEKTNTANYLDLDPASGINNATTNGPFISALHSNSFNDKLLAITNEDLMPMVEQFVAQEVMSYLERYKAATGVYPWAALADGNSNDASNGGYNRNRVPCNTAKPTAWGSGGTPSLPNWLTNGCWSTGWTSLIYYAVAQNRLEGGGGGCSTCTASTLDITNRGTAWLCLTGVSPFNCIPQVVSSGSADLVLIMPGAYTGSRTWPTSFTTITGYFEDSENRNNDDDDYRIPLSTASNRDRIYIVR